MPADNVRMAVLQAILVFSFCVSSTWLWGMAECFAPSRYGAEGLVCYDFSQETTVYPDDSIVPANYVFTGRVFVDRESMMVLKERINLLVSSPAQGRGLLWHNETFCGSIDHVIVDCYPVDQAPAVYSVKEPYLVTELLAGRCNVLDFVKFLKPPEQQVHEVRDGWSITRHLNKTGTAILVLSCRRDDPTDRRIETFTSDGELVYSIALSGGTAGLPARVEIEGFRPVTGQRLWRQVVDIVDRGNDCRLLTGSLGPDELIARIHRPEDEEHPLKYSRTDRSGRKTTLLHVEGAWRDADEWEAEALRRAEREHPLPPSRSEQIRASRPGYGAGSRTAGGAFLAGGVGLFLLAALVWWRSKRT